MARENLPILYRNIMDGLPSDFARDVFLWAVERPGEDRMCYRAEAFAREADQVIGVFRDLLNIAGYCKLKAAARGVPSRILSDEETEDLVGFFATRHANFRYGGNVKPSYARVS